MLYGVLMISAEFFSKKQGICDRIFFLKNYFHKMEKVHQKLNKITYPMGM
jgi:hypothetical protein